MYLSVSCGLCPQEPLSDSCADEPHLPLKRLVTFDKKQQQLEYDTCSAEVARV